MIASSVVAWAGAMADPRLNSVHLDFPRREEFRRAREVLVNGRGLNTQALEDRPSGRGDASNPHTIVEPERGNVPAGVRQWLMDQEGVYPLKVGVNTIGRMPDNDVVLHGPYVSRRHCAILVHAADGCELYDIASKNGTYLNGRRLSGPTRLTSGDEIRMCDRQLIFMSRTDAKDEPGHEHTHAE
jgi:hypothetical protein